MSMKLNKAMFNKTTVFIKIAEIFLEKWRNENTELYKTEKHLDDEDYRDFLEDMEAIGDQFEEAIDAIRQFNINA